MTVRLAMICGVCGHSTFAATGDPCPHCHALALDVPQPSVTRWRRKPSKRNPAQGELGFKPKR